MFQTEVSTDFKKSLLGRWKDEEVLAMDVGGNAKARAAIYSTFTEVDWPSLSSLPGLPRPSSQQRAARAVNAPRCCFCRAVQYEFGHRI